MIAVYSIVFTWQCILIYSYSNEFHTVCISYHIAVSLNDVKDIEDPLNKVEAGLVGGDIPLQSVHIKAKLLDLAAQVILITLMATSMIQ